jgi:hypothetical protein
LRQQRFAEPVSEGGIGSVSFPAWRAFEDYLEECIH